MRLVTVSLALSFAAFSMITPALALPVKKEPVAKDRRAAAVQPAKKVAAVQPAKKDLAVKSHRATAASAKKNVVDAKLQLVAQAAEFKKTTVVRRIRVASIAPATDVITQAPDEVRIVRMDAVRPGVARRETVASASLTPSRMPKLFASSDPVSEARRWIGTNPTDRNSLWCARFMNFVLERSGYEGTGSDAAKSFASYGRRISGPQIGAIAVLTRGKNGGHVGIVSGIDERGNPIIISGNHGHRVGEGVYPRSRVVTYVLPH
jgi:uncharacterized protein (TIGR02594 family)